MIACHCISAFSNLNSKGTRCKTHHSHIVHQNNIKFSILMTKVTKCCKYVSSFMEKLRQN